LKNSLGKIRETVHFEKAHFDFHENGIVVITIKDGVRMEIEDSMAQYDMIVSKKELIPLVVLIKGGNDSTTSKEVRDFSNSEKGRSIIKAQALVTNTLAQKIVTNFIIKFYKTPVEIKLFTEEQKAIDWLKTFL